MSAHALAALSGVMFAVLQVSSAYALQEGLSVRGVTSLQLWLGTLGMAALFPVFGAWHEFTELRADGAALFVIGGLLQFLAGWTLVNASQRRIGAARSSLLIAMTPLFGALLSVVVLFQIPGPVAVLAMTAMVVGAGLVHAQPGGFRGVSVGALLPGLASAFCFGLAAMIVLYALTLSHTPILGSTIGIGASALVHSLTHRPWRAFPAAMPRRTLLTIVVALALAVSLSTYGRWASLVRLDLGTALALGLVSVPMVMVLAPVLLSRSHQRIRWNARFGAVLILAGALTLFLY